MPFAGILKEAFRSRAWLDTVDALFDASGLVIGVLDTEGREIVSSASRCIYCDLAVPEASDPIHTGCFQVPAARSGSPRAWHRGICRAALPCYLVPVTYEGDVLCTVAIGGFVGSTRDRRRLFEMLLGRGVAEQAAREAVRNIPVVGKREVEALARLVGVTAEEAIARAVEVKAHAHHERELELFVEANIAFAQAGGEVASVLEAVVERAMGIVSADSGTLMILRPGTDILEVACARGAGNEYTEGDRLHLGEGIAGRVAQSRRGVLVRGGVEGNAHGTLARGRRTTSTLSVPLTREDRLIGVLEVSVTRASEGFLGEELALLDRFAFSAAVVIDNARAAQGSERKMHELLHLGEYAKVLSGSSDVAEVVRITASVLEKSFDFELGGIVVTGWKRDEATVHVVGSVPQSALEEVVGEAAGWNLADMPLNAIHLVTLRGDLNGTRSDDDDWLTMSVEIMVRDTIVGYLFVASRAAGAFDSHDRRLLEGFAEHAASALERAALFERLRDDFAKTIAALSATLDAGEHAPRGHSDRVMDYAMAIGEQLGLPTDEIELLRFAGLLHDVGKIGVPEEILLKPTKLTPEEMQTVRMHAEIGATIVEQIEFLDALTPVILHHHERWDGGGYPMGIRGTEIPLLARILGVADAFDSMMTERTYRKRMSFAEARAEMTAAAGTQFDPRVVSALFEALDTRALAGATGLLAERARPEDQLPS